MSKKKLSLDEMMKIFKKGEDERRAKSIEEGRLERLKINEPKKEKSSTSKKKTKKQIELEEKEEREKQTREDLEKEASEKQLLYLKRFHPEQYEALVGKRERSPSPTSVSHDFDKPKKLNYKKGNKAKIETEKSIKKKEGDLEKEFKKSMKSQSKLIIEGDVGNIMKGKSDLVKKGNKYSVDTDLDVKKGLDSKVKRALRKSIIEELDRRLEGKGLISDSDSDSSSDEEDKKREIKNYSKIIKHLISHIEDPKEPTDKKDVRDAKSLISSIEKVKRKRGRPKKL
jgi:hypothetical protein